MRRQHRLSAIRSGSARLFLWVLVGGCATTPGAKPHEMSVAQHEAAARAEDHTASGHATQFQPGASVGAERCAKGTAVVLSHTGAADVCWSSTTNPTDAHRRAAEAHRKQAADHRAGSRALQEAEARACVGVSPEDRDMSPFEHSADITNVAELTERQTHGKRSIEHVVGVTVTFRAVQGMTPEWLKRVIDCHMARNAAMGHAMPEMPNCPLVPKGVQATVSSTGSGFAVAVRSEEPAVASEILARAKRLSSQGPN